ncbi:MAG: Maf family protein [Methylocystis sp.]|nr:Maf family protein [Methylocystis sp.]MCA3583270.1 Maf family protein [Methylocystis sp.]MCA3588055.1 Maf family protein [Methylocystis sp.]MCA3591503.1 Maf family protein [Methylocystis sp.]
MSDPADLHPLWLGDKPLVLASGSATRFALLTAAGIPVEVMRPEVDERAIADPQEAQGVAADQIARSLAHAKALAVSKRVLDRIVIGADQTLALGKILLHKPADRDAAAEQLSRLSGRTHVLHSAVVIARSNKTIVSFVGAARLTMRRLSPAMIDRYLDVSGDAVRVSVGGYQLERAGMHLFRRITGEHTAILGLPMLETLAQLRRLGLVAE